MTTNKTEKDFDCVEFKRQAQTRIYAAIRQLSPAEEIAYFRQAAERGPLGNWWRKVRQPADRTAVSGEPLRPTP